MNENNKKDLRLYVSIEGRKTSALIDQKEYLGLENSKVDRIDLFIFALAKGLMLGTPLNITSKKESFVRQASINTLNESLILSLYIGNCTTEFILENGVDYSEAYNMADIYANSGFNSIQHDIDTMPIDNLIWHEIKILDDFYEMIVKNK